MGIALGGAHLDLWVRGGRRVQSLGAWDEVDEDDLVLGDVAVEVVRARPVHWVAVIARFFPSWPSLLKGGDHHMG